MPRVTPRPRLALASALAALLAHVSGWVLTDRLQADPFDATTTGLSVLAATGQPHAWLFTTSLLVSEKILAGMRDSLLSVLDARPDALVVRSTTGAIDETAAALDRALTTVRAEG